MKHKYSIPFVGLAIGKHIFDFEIEDSFFQSIEYSPVQSGKLNVELELEKKETMLIAKFSVNGVVEKECDRCNAPLEISIQNELEVIYKFGHEQSEDENLIVLSPEAYEINVKEPIYQMIIIAIPSRNIHKDGECDEEMLNLLRKYTVNKNDIEEFDEESDGEDEADEESIWSILKHKN